MSLRLTWVTIRSCLKKTKPAQQLTKWSLGSGVNWHRLVCARLSFTPGMSAGSGCVAECHVAFGSPWLIFPCGPVRWLRRSKHLLHRSDNPALIHRSHGRRRALSPKSCHLTFLRVLWHTGVHTRIHESFEKQTRLAGLGYGSASRVLA